MNVIACRFCVMLGAVTSSALAFGAANSDQFADTPAAIAAAPSYAITDLGTLGGQQASAYAINASGQIAGSAGTAAGGAHAFLRTNGTNDDLGTLSPDGASSAVALNDLGVAVGWSTGATDLRMHAALFRHGTVIDLGFPAGFRSSSATAINNADVVVGSSTGKGPGAYGTFTHATLWANGTATDLGTLPGGRNSNATGINDAGQIIGTSSSPAGGRGFVIKNGVMTTLNPLPRGISSWAFAINGAGHIAGASLTGIGAAEHAVLWIDGAIKDLGTAPGFRSSAGLAVNASDTVVGTVREPINKIHAALFQDGVAYDLNTLIPANSGWVLQTAHAISDDGVIIGVGIKNGLQRAFALTPR